MTAPSNANTSGLTPTDALRLVPVEPTEAMVANALGTLTVPGPVEQTKAMIRQFYRAMLAAAPASPLPGGGECSETSGELDPRLLDWGYTSMDEVIAHLGKLLDNQTAFDGLAAPTGDA